LRALTIPEWPTVKWSGTLIAPHRGRRMKLRALGEAIMHFRAFSAALSAIADARNCVIVSNLVLKPRL
jgi:hypothetical protein